MRAGLIVLMSIAVLVTLANAKEFGNAPKGKAIAEIWCKTCHLISSKPTGPLQDGVPTFPSVAVKLKQKGERFRIAEWLQEPHGQMERLNLSRQNIEDLVTYIESLAPKKDK